MQITVLSIKFIGHSWRYKLIERCNLKVGTNQNLLVGIYYNLFSFHDSDHFEKYVSDTRDLRIGPNQKPLLGMERITHF